MTVPPANPAPSGHALPRSPRGTQYAAGVLIAVCLLLLGVRYYIDRAGARPTEFKLAPHRVDLNTATRSELMQLPGIGAGRADKILAYRESVGTFQRVEDLRAVNGIGEITLRRLKPLIHVETADNDQSDEPLRLSRRPAEGAPRAAKSIVADASSSPSSPGPTSSLRGGSKKPPPDASIDLNQASVAELQRLPGVGPTLAGRIVERRQQQPFASVDELRKVGGIGAKKLEQLRPYVVVRN